MKHWFMFGLLGLIWGSSFLLIKIGLIALDPLFLVAIRLSLAAISFVIFVLITRKRFPNDRSTLIKLTVAAIINTALPFVLITWGENTIDSGLAGVLNSTTPLFSLIIAHLALEDDRISLGKLFGLITGFAGIILLAMRSADPTHPNPLAGQLAVVVAAISYALAAVFIRRNLRHVDPIIVAGSTVVVGALAVSTLALIIVRPLPNLFALPGNVIFAMLDLGLVNTFIAYILYFSLIAQWGASRATMVTYLMPPISLILGIIFNHEPANDWRLWLGAALIVGGVGLANLKTNKAATPITLNVPEEPSLN